VIERAAAEVCRYRGWELLAVNARTNHVHAIVAAAHSPERVLNDLKSWGTRQMVEAGLWTRGKDVWARHGSTQYLWDQDALEAAYQYVREAQDAPRDDV
jgi:REP element-mobilizing transposase RayT